MIELHPSIIGNKSVSNIIKTFTDFVIFIRSKVVNQIKLPLVNLCPSALEIWSERDMTNEDYIISANCCK